MKDVEFNLLDEPWVRVLCPDCTAREVSLTDALLHAQDYTALAGELPTQDVAMLRLMLAVLHTVFWDHDANGEAAALTQPNTALVRWRGLWQPGRFPEKPLRDYLSAQHEKFWLFHPERPFWQVPQAEIGTAYDAAKLNGEVSQSGNKLRLFALCAGAGMAELSYAQAARWLLYVNGFDDTSAKPKGKGLPSVGAGWLGKLGLIQVQGANLFETLMLNLVLLRDGEQPWGAPEPCWEWPQARSAERTEIPQPDNAAALLTLQSRRLLLHREKGVVNGYTLLGGDFFPRENAFCEQMTLWRGVQKSKNAPVEYVPQRHDPSKQFWREFPSVFTQDGNGKQPGLVRWIAKLQSARILPARRMIRFQITGVGYGDKDFFVTETFSDTLAFHAQMLDEMGMKWRAIVVDEIGRCEQLAKAVGELARDLAQAAGGSEEDGRNAAAPAREQFYFAVDQPFRLWLHEIDPEWEQEREKEAVLHWREDIRQIALKQGKQQVLQSGNAAFIGRFVQQGKGKQGEKAFHCSAPEAYSRFLSKVHHILQS